jgi:hypothetical protein
MNVERLFIFSRIKKGESKNVEKKIVTSNLRDEFFFFETRFFFENFEKKEFKS